jgi:hypothetical protein
MQREHETEIIPRILNIKSFYGSARRAEIIAYLFAQAKGGLATLTN